MTIPSVQVVLTGPGSAQGLRSEMLQLKACMDAMQQRLDFIEQQFGGGSNGSSGASNGKPSHAKFMGLF